MKRRAFYLPLVGLLAAAAGAAAVAITAVGTGITNPKLGCSPSAGAGFAVAQRSISGPQLNAGQIANAWIIYSIGTGLGLPPQAEVIALSAAMQESALENLNPVTASRTFYQRLEQVRNWQSLPVAVAAQDVQHGSTPGAYARWQHQASQLVALFSGGTGACAVDGANVVPRNSGVSLPRNYSVPKDTPIAVVLAIRFALAQLGTAYDFGGTCADAHSGNLALHCDCSSLVQQSYRAGGVPLPRTTFDQVNVGRPVYSTGSLRPGDLLFLVGSDGSPSSPGHVGMYIGDGLVIQAPQTGQNVQLTPLGEWASIIVAMRRIA